MPRGASTLWSGPAPKPSSDIVNALTRSLLILSPDGLRAVHVVRHLHAGAWVWLVLDGHEGCVRRSAECVRERRKLLLGLGARRLSRSRAHRRGCGRDRLMRFPRVLAPLVGEVRPNR